MKNSKIIFTLCLGLFAGNCFCQNVGIGTITPNRGKFELYGAVGATSAIFKDSVFYGVSFQRNSPAIGYNQYFTDQSRYISNGTAFVQWLNTSTGSMNFDAFATSGTANAAALNPQRMMTIRSNGDVSFNTAESDASLFVANNAGGTLSIVLKGTTYNSEFNKSGLNTYINGGKAGSKIYINDNTLGHVYMGSTNVRVGVNVLNPASLLDIKQVGGHGLVLVEPSTFHNWEFVTTKNLTDNACDYYLYYNGAYKGNFFYVDGTYSPISDNRLKSDVTPLSNVLEKVMRMNPVSYQMKSASSRTALGFLAQEVNDIFPEVVGKVTSKEMEIGYPGMDDLYTMSYDALAPVVIGAIKEQQLIIKDLKDRNEKIRQKIEYYNNMLK